jgi:hypothetical protein
VLPARAGASCHLPTLARKKLPGRIRRIEAPDKALCVECENGEIASPAARRPRDCGDLNELARICHFKLSLPSLTPRVALCSPTWGASSTDAPRRAGELPLVLEGPRFDAARRRRYLRASLRRRCCQETNARERPDAADPQATSGQQPEPSTTRSATCHFGNRVLRGPGHETC